MTSPISYSMHHDTATAQVLRLTLESKSSTDSSVIGMFRNTFPVVQDYINDVVVGFKSKDSVDFGTNKAKFDIEQIKTDIEDLQFTRSGHIMVQCPEGFTDQYIPYLKWLSATGVDFIKDAEKALQDYYTQLSVFISSKEAKTSQKDYSRVHGEMQKELERVKDGLASFFNSKSSVALQPINKLFDRAANIPESVKLAMALNNQRLGLSNKSIVSLTERIAELLDLLAQGGDDKVPDISSAAANSIAEGAMIAGRYVEFVAVLRYRITEALTANSIMAKTLREQISKYN